MGNQIRVSWSRAISQPLFDDLMDTFAAHGFEVFETGGTGDRLLSERSRLMVDHDRVAMDLAESRRAARSFEARDRGRALAGPVRMVDPGVAPREGETAGASIARRFAEYRDQCGFEGRPAVGIVDWMKHDRLSNERIYVLAERERGGPDRRKKLDMVMSEVNRAARALMARNDGLKLGAALVRALAEDSGLSARYRAAALGLDADE